MNIVPAVPGQTTYEDPTYVRRRALVKFDEHTQQRRSPSRKDRKPTCMTPTCGSRRFYTQPGQRICQVCGERRPYWDRKNKRWVSAEEGALIVSLQREKP